MVQKVGTFLLNIIQILFSVCTKKYSNKIRDINKKMYVHNTALLYQNTFRECGCLFVLVCLCWVFVACLGCLFGLLVWLHLINQPTDRPTNTRNQHTEPTTPPTRGCPYALLRLVLVFKIVVFFSAVACVCIATIGRSSFARP